MPSDNLVTTGHSARHVINALRQHQTQQVMVKKKSCIDWFKRSNFIARLNDCVTFAYILDSITYVVAAASDSANDFISNGAPAVINGIGCIAPSLIPFLPSIICICKKHYDQEESADLEEYKEEVDTLFAGIILSLNILDAGPRQTIMAEITKAKQKMIAKYIEDNAATPLNTLDNIVNIIYLIVRGVGGVLIMIKGIEDLDDEQNSKLEDIGKWMTVGSTVAYMIYYLVCLLPKRITNFCESRKKFDANEELVDEEKSENSVASNASLNSVVIIPTLFSPRQSIAAAQDIPKSAAAMLHQPLLSPRTTATSY